MPVYSTQCEECQKQQDRKLSFADYDAIKAGSQTLSCSCGGLVALEFTPGAVSFVLKDGESGGWVSKAGKENRYRSKRGQVMAQRERDHVRPNRLQPNYNGQIAESWGEARDAAYQSTYAKVKSEHGAIAASKAATESARTYDTHVKQEAP